MKKIIIFVIISLCLVGFFQAGILRSLLMFVLIGAVPGTAFSLSPDIMTMIVGAICLLIVMSILGALMPYLVMAYRRYILRKKLLTIPAFRRLIRTRQA